MSKRSTPTCKSPMSNVVSDVNHYQDLLNYLLLLVGVLYIVNGRPDSIIIVYIKSNNNTVSSKIYFSDI